MTMTSRRSANSALYNPNNNATTKLDCCQRVSAELRHPPYNAKEPNGEVLHGPNTFGPTGLWILGLKTGLTVWAASVFFEGFFATPGKFHIFYLAYLTNWTYTLSSIYMISSWYHTLQSTILSRTSNNNTNVTWFHTFTWILFSVVGPAEIVVALGYWGLEWDGTSAGFFYRNIMIHGVIVILVLVDGLFLNRIPIRPRQLSVLLVYLTAYLVWTIIYELANIGNPYTEGEDSDDQLYAALNWTEEPLTTILAASQLLFVILPIAFAVVWGLSLWSFPCGLCGGGAHRRYVNDADKAAYVEMSNFV